MMLRAFLAGILVVGAANPTFAAGEIDSHRVWGNGLFGLHLPDTDSPAPVADGVYRDRLGALHDSGVAMSTGAVPTSTNSSSAASQVAIRNQGFSRDLAVSPWTGSESAPNNQSYSGGYGQYGPSNNLDLIQAGLTSQLRASDRSTADTNLIGTVSNQQNLAAPDMSIPGNSTYINQALSRQINSVPATGTHSNVAAIGAAAAGISPQNKADARVEFGPKNFQSTNFSANEMRDIDLSASSAKNNRRAKGNHVATSAAQSSQLQSKSANYSDLSIARLPRIRQQNKSVIGNVNGFIQYNDDEVTLFGDDGIVHEASGNLISVDSNSKKSSFRDTNGAIKKQISSITKLNL